MGMLLDGKIWADALNQLEALRPPLGKPVSQSDAEKIKKIACEVLTRLVEDPEFLADIEKVRELTAKLELPAWAADSGFQEFLNSFMQLENKVLVDAKVNTVVSRDLEQEVRNAAKSDDPKRFDRLKDMVVFLRSLACEPTADDDPARPTWQVVWRGIKGVALIGIDAGSTGAATMIFGPFGAAVGVVASVSAGYGFVIVIDAIKGRW